MRKEENEDDGSMRKNERERIDNKERGRNTDILKETQKRDKTGYKIKQEN